MKNDNLNSWVGIPFIPGGSVTTGLKFPNFAYLFDEMEWSDFHEDARWAYQKHQKIHDEMNLNLQTKPRLYYQVGGEYWIVKMYCTSRRGWLP